MKNQPQEESGFSSSVVVQKKTPTYTHCWHERPLCHRAWFHQICDLPVVSLLIEGSRWFDTSLQFPVHMLEQSTRCLYTQRLVRDTASCGPAKHLMPATLTRRLAMTRGRDGKTCSRNEERLLSVLGATYSVDVIRLLAFTRTALGTKEANTPRKNSCEDRPR